MESDEESFDLSDSSSEPDSDYSGDTSDDDADQLATGADLESNFALAEGFSSVPRDYNGLSTDDDDFVPKPNPALFPGECEFVMKTSWIATTIRYSFRKKGEGNVFSTLSFFLSTPAITEFAGKVQRSFASRYFIMFYKTLTNSVRPFRGWVSFGRTFRGGDRPLRRVDPPPHRIRDSKPPRRY
jgi:hypothetical protein